MSEWRETTIENLAAPERGALSTGPFGSAISSRFFQTSGIPVIRGSNLSLDIETRLVDDDIVFVSEEKAQKFERSIAKKGDLVFTCWGTIGQIGLIDSRAHFDRYVVSNKQMKLTPNTQIVDPLFLYYSLSSPKSIAHVQSSSIGSSVPGFNLTQLRQIPVRLPPIWEQRSISSALDALDEKIAVNERIITSSSNLCETLHRELHNKSEKEANLGEVTDLLYGKSLPKTKRTPGKIPVYGSGGQGGTHSEALVTGPGIIIGRKGTVGSVHWSEDDFFPIDTTFYASMKSPSISLEYLYFTLSGLHLESMNSDSAVPGLNRSEALSKKIRIPEPESLYNFTKQTREMFSHTHARRSESRTLAELRDTLLPQLMSGKLRVKDAEKIVEDNV